MIDIELTSMSIQVKHFTAHTTTSASQVQKNDCSFCASVKFYWQMQSGKHVLHLSAVPEMHLDLKRGVSL